MPPRATEIFCVWWVEQGRRHRRSEQIVSDSLPMYLGCSTCADAWSPIKVISTSLALQIAHSMLRNQHIELELYLHKLISPLMTCLVTKRIGISPWEDHWAVRSAAADAIASVCRQYGDKYVDLQPRICKQLVKALTDPSKPVTTLFGMPHASLDVWLSIPLQSY